ncbi:SUMF1/EgtB/PvdO family nonheme iron enzyme [Sunxiuqinia sp. sy24]|uniref:SUMF1/EgtB/PvdO family nonheme iron enzyme n=1 Tax=Sunxiuqinia sp. sy24 TaxID=3461495 RepID=UPI0040456B91
MPDHIVSVVKNTTDSRSKKQLLADINTVITLQNSLKLISFNGTKLALEDIISSHPQVDKELKNYLKELDKKEARINKIKPGIYQLDKKAINEIQLFLNNHRAVLLRNPYLNNKELLVLRHKVKDARKAMAAQIGRNKNNWSTADEIRRQGWNNDICALSNLQGEIKINSLIKSDSGAPILDIDLHWDSKRLLYSTVGSNKRWQVVEHNLADQSEQVLTPHEYDDIDYFDPCYLPNGKVVLSTTAAYVAVPCVGGSNKVSSLHLLDPANKDLRQLNFGQESEWNPVVLNNGKVCYLRWEYTDNSHYFTRILMNMNPDGTTKKEYYGSGSYFPNSLFDVKPIPNHPSQFIGIVSGHHGLARSGRLIIFDPVKGRKEADGVVQEIPGYGKTVEPIIKDNLVDGVWPQFLTPYPLSENYFLVSAKMGPDELWGIYLVDKFDNMTLVYEEEGAALVEPNLLQKRPVPPVIPERVNLTDSTSTVYIMDIYQGQGLKGVPRGTVKQLRIFTYEYSYNKRGGHDIIGLESSWDVKRILGTVPVEEDGSATFKIPANTPVSLQPLDENGASLQLMRSWMTGMPGEVVSCVGCHESQNTMPESRFTIASRKQPSEIRDWHGDIRPFTYNNEVKPIIEKRCVACHNGNSQSIPDFSSDENSGYHGFSKSYMALHPYVRRPGCESDFYTLEPMDYYANTSDLVQILGKDHYGVELNEEEWDRLLTWIDLNVPYHGEYNAPEFNGYNQYERRKELAKEFANVCINSKQELEKANQKRKETGPITPIRPDYRPKKKTSLALNGWPLSADELKKLQEDAAVNNAITKQVDIGDGMVLEFIRIPAGTYIMGDNAGQPDQKERIVTIEKPFWMMKTEVTNKHFRTIFKDHDSRAIDQQWKDHIFPGYPANEDQMPVIRVSWEQAMEFGKLLSEKTGLNITLPTEEQWEWAARAGSNTAMHYGNINDDFSKYENLADISLKDLAVVGVDPKPMGAKDPRRRYYDFVPRDTLYNDGVLVPQNTGQYHPNAWGLHDMLGNVAEWTRSDYKHFIFGLSDNKEQLKTAKGGSWRDRPKYATSASKEGYLSYQKVFNVGFRLIIED